MSSQSRFLLPLAWSYGGWRTFFLVAAIWNLLGAAGGLIFPSLNLKLFYDASNVDYLTIFLNRGLWWAVLIFGAGYLLIAMDPARNIGIILMGVMGKTIVALNWFFLYATGRATFIAVLAALGDSAFTVLFLVYLFQGPRFPKIEAPESQ